MPYGSKEEDDDDV